MPQPTPQAHPAAAGPVVQRVVGFEFEVGDWRSYSTVGGPPPKPEQEGINVFKPPSGSHINQAVKPFGVEAAGKKGALHTGTHFKIEADGPYKKEVPTLPPPMKGAYGLWEYLGWREGDEPVEGAFGLWGLLGYKEAKWLNLDYQGVMDIEFVTDPFPETDQGVADLKSVLAEMESILGRIQKYAGCKELIGEFVGSSEHGLSNTSTCLAAGPTRIGAPMIKMQATSGVRFRDIPVLFQYFGGSLESETTEQAEQRAYARKLTYGKSTARDLAAAPGAADVAFIILVKKGVIAAEGLDHDQKSAVDDLRGLLSLIILYIHWLRGVKDEGLKLFLPFLSRYSIADRVAQLDPELVKHLKGHRKEFIEAVLRGVETMPVVNTAFWTWPKIEPGSSLLPLGISKSTEEKHPEFWPMLRRLTVQEWLEGVLAGKDYLTKGGMIEFLESTAQYEEEIAMRTAPKQYAKSIGIFLRGYGTTDTVVGDTTGLALLENRSIARKQAPEMKIAEAKEAAVAYLTFFKQIKEAQGEAERIGAFPRMPTFD